MIQKPEQSADHNEKGYTMIELLMVLSILVVMTGVVVINMVPMKDSREIKQFIQLLTSDLHYAQQYALTEQIKVQIKFNNASKQYTLETDSRNKGKIKTIQFPEGVYFEELTSSLELEYGVNGTIQKGGTMLLRTKKETYKIVFLLGKGRFYIEKL
jgi:competence protein ComGD